MYIAASLILLVLIGIPLLHLIASGRKAQMHTRRLKENNEWFKTWLARAENAKTNEEVLQLCREALERDKR